MGVYLLSNAYTSLVVPNHPDLSLDSSDFAEQAGTYSEENEVNSLIRTATGHVPRSSIPLTSALSLKILKGTMFERWTTARTNGILLGRVVLTTDALGDNGKVQRISFESAVFRKVPNYSLDGTDPGTTIELQLGSKQNLGLLAGTP